MTMEWYVVAGSILRYLLLPVVKVVLLVVYLLRLLLSPFIYITQLVFRLCMVPVDIVARFEPVWYYLGGAVLVGVISAFTLHATYQIIIVVLRLNEKTVVKVSDTPARGPDVKTYRKAREKRKKQAEKEQQEIEATAQALATSPLLKEALKQMRRDSQDEDTGSPTSRIRGKESLYDQTILEHTDEEDS